MVILIERGSYMTMMDVRAAEAPVVETLDQQAFAPLEIIATTAPREGLMAALERDPVGTRLRMIGNTGLTLGDLDMSEIADDMVKTETEWYAPAVRYSAVDAPSIGTRSRSELLDLNLPR